MRLAGQGSRAAERGYAMAGLLVALSVMAVLMSAALPQWSHLARREKEIELIWRGEQYARAVELFQRRFANAYPPTLDVLVEQKFLRKKYKDPITGDDFQPIFMGQALTGAAPGPGGGTATRPLGQTGPGTAGAAGPIVGVTSKSPEQSIRLYNGRDKYNEWAFVYTPATNRPGQPGQGGAPEMPGQPGQPLPPGMRPGGPLPPGMRPPGQGTSPFGTPGAGPPTGVRPPVMLPPMPPPTRPPGGG